MALSKKTKKEMKETLAMVFADGYRKTAIKYDGATVYLATYNQPTIADFCFILVDGDYVWFACGEEYEKIKKEYFKRYLKVDI